MLNVELKPDRLTYNTLISACVKINKLDAAIHFFEEMKVTSMYWKPSLEPPNKFINWLINRPVFIFCYSEFHSFQEQADKYDQEDIFPDVVTYTTLLKVNELFTHFAYHVIRFVFYKLQIFRIENFWIIWIKILVVDSAELIILCLVLAYLGNIVAASELWGSVSVCLLGMHSVNPNKKYDKNRATDICLYIDNTICNDTSLKYK